MSRNLTDHSEESLTAPTVGAHSVVENLIPFRKTKAALEGLAAGDDDPLSLSPAISLGSAVQAVVMRLSNKRVRIRVESPSREEEDWGSR